MFANKILTEKDTDQIRFSILASEAQGMPHLSKPETKKF